jgi:hypothetical protein
MIEIICYFFSKNKYLFWIEVINSDDLWLEFIEYVGFFIMNE